MCRFLVGCVFGGAFVCLMEWASMVVCPHNTVGNNFFCYLGGCHLVARIYIEFDFCCFVVVGFFVGCFFVCLCLACYLLGGSLFCIFMCLLVLFFFLVSCLVVIAAI